MCRRSSASIAGERHDIAGTAGRARRHCGVVRPQSRLRMVLHCGSRDGDRSRLAAEYPVASRWSPYPSEAWSPPSVGALVAAGSAVGAAIGQPQSYSCRSLGRLACAPHTGVESVHSPSYGPHLGHRRGRSSICARTCGSSRRRARPVSIRANSPYSSDDFRPTRSSISRTTVRDQRLRRQVSQSDAAAAHRMGHAAVSERPGAAAVARLRRHESVAAAVLSVRRLPRGRRLQRPKRRRQGRARQSPQPRVGPVAHVDRAIPHVHRPVPGRQRFHARRVRRRRRASSSTSSISSTPTPTRCSSKATSAT